MNNKKSLIKSQITFNQIHAKVSMLLSKYIKENDHVLKQIDPKKIATELNLKDTLKNGFDNIDSMMSFIKNYLSNTNHLKNPGYMGHQVAVQQDLAMAQDLTVSKIHLYREMCLRFFCCLLHQPNNPLNPL